MSNPRIEVDVVANVAGITDGVAAATSKLDQLGEAAKSTAPKFDGLTKSTSRYNAVGIDFARLIQDAPFGIIGYGNNITQLAQSFSSLGNAGDTFSSKFKLAIGAIFSSGNLLILGVSALTTAFTILQQKGFFKTEDAAKSLADELDKYKKTLGETTQAQLEGAANADKEIVKITALRGVIEDETVSREKRLAAVKELKKEAPSIFKNLTDEQILAGQVGDSYARLTQILVARATAASGINKIVALADEERIILEKNASILQQIAAFEQKAANFRKQGQTELVTINENQIRYLKEQNPEIQRLAQIEAERVKLTSLVNENLAQSVDYNDKAGKSIDANKVALEKYKASWDEYNLQQESANFLAEKLNFTTKDYEKNIKAVLTAIPDKPIRIETDDEALQAFNDELYKTQMAAYNAELELMKTSDAAFQFSDNLSKIENKEIKINTNVEGFGKEVADVLPFLEQLETALNPKKFTDFEERVSDFAFTVRDLLQNNLANAFIDLGYTIGEALATGGNVIQAVGQSVLKSFGRFLGQFGEQLIAYGVATIAFGKASIGLSNPFTAIPSGGLAIAAGVALTAISGIIGSLGKKGMGGGGGGGSVGSSGVGGGSEFVGGGAQGGMFASQRDLTGELVVRGQDLVYVFGQANNRINKG